MEATQFSLPPIKLSGNPKTTRNSHYPNQRFSGSASSSRVRPMLCASTSPLDTIHTCRGPVSWYLTHSAVWGVATNLSQHLIFSIHGLVNSPRLASNSFEHKHRILIAGQLDQAAGGLPYTVHRFGSQRPGGASRCLGPLAFHWGTCLEHDELSVRCHGLRIHRWQPRYGPLQRPCSVLLG